MLQLLIAAVSSAFFSENQAFQTNLIMFFGEVKSLIGKNDSVAGIDFGEVVDLAHSLNK